MNATEPTEELCLRTRVHKREPEYTQSASFYKSFLTRPCYGCQSIDHSLLRRNGERVISDKVIPIFAYECDIVEPIDPYPDQDTMEITIAFELGAQDYAKVCNYDEELAVQRIPQLLGEEDRERGYPPYVDSFMDKVKSACRLHQKEATIRQPREERLETGLTGK